jgi:hypothetical protein
MKKIIWFMIMLLILSSCKTMVALKDTHPGLNRQFRLRQDVPGDYPYCRQYEQEMELHIQMFGP